MRPYHVLIGLFIAFIVYVWAQAQLFKHEADRQVKERRNEPSKITRRV